MKDPTLEPLRTAALYNPHLLSREETVGLFTVRSELHERLLGALRSAPAGEAPQHHLLVGQRGMGKTMLLRRLRFAIEEDAGLAGRWLPLSFPEEQYNVGSLSDFWLNCLDALSDAIEEQDLGPSAKSLDQETEAVANLDGEEARQEAALDLLTRVAKKAERRLVLLVDNVDLIFERTRTQGWALREALSDRPELLLIGATSRALEETYEYNEPFYDFFEIHELAGLSTAETTAFLQHYADRWETPQVRRVTEEDPARIRVLHTLTGGNPRTIVLLYTVLAKGIDGDVRTDLETLLDHSTPLYKARLEALAPQAQQVLHGLAVYWHPTSAGELAEELRVDVNLVSAQLQRLVKQGIVEKVLYEPEAKTGFQIAERFFNIWYLMRVTRRARRKLLWLVEFLRLFYSTEQLVALAEGHLHGSSELPKTARVRSAEYSFVLADVVNRLGLRGALEHQGLRLLLGDKDLSDMVSEVIDLNGKDAHLKARRDCQEELAALSREVMSHPFPSPFEARTLWQSTSGLPITVAARKRVIGRLMQASAHELSSIQDSISQLRGALFESIGSVELAKRLEAAFREGYMLSIFDLKGAASAEAGLGCRGLVAVVLITLSKVESIGSIADEVGASLHEPDVLEAWGVMTLSLLERAEGDRALQALHVALSILADQDSMEALGTVLPAVMLTTVAGRAGEVASLLDELSLSDRVRPLREALEAIAERKPQHFRRLAPEVRGPAEEIARQLVGEEWLRSRDGEPRRAGRSRQRKRPARAVAAG